MDLDKKSKYESLYNIKLSDFYHFVTDVMADFGYSLYRTVKEVEGRRRIETWVHGNSEDQKAIIWLEVLKPNDTLDPYLTTDVLRTMNEENVTRLFFFTNGYMTDEDTEVLEGSNHFIFTTEEIVETLTAIESKKSVKTVRKRKTVKIPAAMVLIKNFFRNNEIQRKQIPLRVSAAPELMAQYKRLVQKILVDIDSVKDINDIPSQLREKLKRIQFELLPELAKTPCYVFPGQFYFLRDMLFNLIQLTIVYIGNFIDYEAEDDLIKTRSSIDEILYKLDEVDDKVLSFKADMMFQAEKTSVKLIGISGIIMFVSLLLLIVVKFSR